MFEINLLSGHVSNRPRRQTAQIAKNVVEGIGAASEEKDGLMPGADKAKLDTVMPGAAQNMLSVTWAALVALRDESNLVPGMFYRITDYTTTTTQVDTRSAGHVFDIIVRADSENILNENAFAVQHEGDTYFAKSKLAAWQLKYCLDNDTTKFLWADPDGKGVIYHLKDEFNNECPFDFKNIQFKRYRCYEVDNAALEPVYFDNYYCWQTDGGLLLGDDTDFVWYYTFAIKDNPDVDFSLNKEHPEGSAYNSDLCSCSDNIILKNIVTVSLDDETFLTQQSLNNIVLLSLQEELGYMNIVHNCFGPQNHDITIFNGCESVRTCERCFDITGDVSFSVFGGKCYSLVLGEKCYSNTFGNGCDTNTFGNYCGVNTFGNGCHTNTFGNKCNNNTFGNGCGSNTFGNDCCYNTFGNGCYENTFGNYCSYNHYDNYVQSVKAALNSFMFNTIFEHVYCVEFSCEDIGSGAVQNILVYSGIGGTVGNPVNIEIPARNGALLEVKSAAATTLEI